MSPASFNVPASEAVAATVDRLSATLGAQIRDARLARRWTTQRLADEAGVSRSLVYMLERGESASLAAAVRLTGALGLRLDLLLEDPRRGRQSASRTVDAVHSAMGELEAAHLRRLGFQIAIDEPYQHYQFAGRADIAAWATDARAFLHLENRTRFPDFQEMAGSYNAKRAYLAASIGERVGVRRWASETHVIVALWSSEVLHALRIRGESFAAICPDRPDGFIGWWQGNPHASGRSSTLVVLDPTATGRQRLFIGFDEAQSARPRHSGYAEAAARLAADGR
jgi:transcriptional regulator with XRE-family HTH domain